MQVKIVENGENPLKVVAARKPKHGGRTLAVFTNRDGRGVERAWKYLNEKGHKLA